MSKRFQGGILGAGFDPLKAPNAPTIGTASGESGAASVSFTAPSNVGGSAVSSYAVVASPGGIGASGTTSPITVSGLTNGTTYTFSVAAINSYGFSPYSGTVTATAGLFVEDVFSTYLYTGNGATQTITNGIDLSSKGGLVWIKARSGSQATAWHMMADTARGTGKGLSSNSTGAEFTNATFLTSFNSNGFNPGTETSSNGSGTNFASWTFRKAPKFFDVVTYTGDGNIRTIAHNLGVAPGCIIIKATSAADNWSVYHRGIGGSYSAHQQAIFLNLTNAAFLAPYWNDTAPTATNFTLGTAFKVNEPGVTYVAYLFAHDQTADGIIQCGSFTTDGSGNATVNLGWEPQWLLQKRADAAGSWAMFDNMRGLSMTQYAYMFANASDAEASNTGQYLQPTSTGYVNQNSGLFANSTYIYIAIRRGPMKTPTVGTSVFYPNAYTGNGTSQTFTVGFPPDMAISMGRRNNTNARALADKMRGTTQYLYSTNTSAEATSTAGSDFSAFGNVTYSVGAPNQTYINTSGAPLVDYIFRRAPGFFDVVCYTGTGVARTVNHNLGVAPELMIVKRRDNVDDWGVYAAPHPSAATGYFKLNTSATFNATSTAWDNTQPTSSVFTVGTNAMVGASGGTYVAYLFASCPGVSKVGSYTGNGSSQTINCGFSSGARFFLVKRTDSTGDWWVWDSARGIVAAADPALRLNSTAAEVTSADAVDTESTGIIVNQEATCNINVNGATYIFLAIS